MSNPSLTATVIDPGSLAQPANTDQIPIYCGVASTGTDFAIVEYAQESDLLAGLGAGHLTDVAQAALQFAPSVKVMKLPVTNAGTFAATDSDDLLTATSLTGTPLQFLRGKIVITGSPIPGTTLISAGTVMAKLTLDAWDIPFVDPSYTDPFAIPASGIVVLPGTGGLAVHLTTTLTPNIGDEFNFDVTPGHYSGASVAACLTPLLAPTSGIFTYLVFTGDAATAAAANTVALAIIALLTSFYTKGRYYLALEGTGLDTDVNVVAAFAATLMDPPFDSAGYGFAYWQSPRATPSRGRFALREHDAIGIRVSTIAISTDPGRAADGPIVPIKGISYDAVLQGSLLHDARIGVLRSWHPESEGYFANRQRMLAKSDSNFESWQFGAVMCVALRAVRKALFRFALDSLRRTATSTMDPKDAADVKTTCENEIDQVLVIPQNVRGLPGHISARKVTVNLTTVLPAVRVAVQIRPFGYPTDLEATIEYGNAAG